MVRLDRVRDRADGPTERTEGRTGLDLVSVLAERHDRRVRVRPVEELRHRIHCPQERRHGLRHGRPRDGAKREDTDLELRALDRQGLRERQNEALGACVDGLAPAPVQGGIGSGVDDDAQLGSLRLAVETGTVLHEGEREVDRAHDVDVDDRRDERVDRRGHVHLEEGLVPRDAGVVDEDVELAELLDGERNRLRGSVDGADVVRCVLGLAAVGLDRRDDTPELLLLRRDVLDHDLHTLRGERAGVAFAESLRRARDEGDGIRKRSHDVRCLVTPSAQEMS